MKFTTENSENIGQQRLVYLIDEYSFFTGNVNNKIDLELIVNKISLVVEDNKIVDVNGYCGLGNWMKSNYEIPEFRKGILKVEHTLKYGFAYGINSDEDDEFPVYVNIQTGWVCVGNPEKMGNAVEFINNCVAVIGRDQEFVSLWLRPDALPNI